MLARPMGGGRAIDHFSHPFTARVNRPCEFGI